MHNHLFVLLTLSLIYAAQNSSVCPSSPIVQGKIQILNADIFQYSSINYDVMYQLSQNITEPQLKGYRIEKEIANNLNTFTIKKFNVTADINGKILFVSQLGNCVVIQTKSSIVAYLTTKYTFDVIQTLKLQDFTTLTANQDCSIVKITYLGMQRVYLNSLQNAVLKFPVGSIFDSTFTYGVDSFNTLYQLSDNSYSSVKIDPLMIQSNPQLITKSLILDALVLVTNNIQNGKYALTIFDTQNNELVYYKSWQRTGYATGIQFQMQKNLNYILVQDSIGILHLLNLVRNTILTVNNINLDKSTDSPLFNTKSIIAFDQDLIFSYQNKAIYYFQNFNSTLYSLGNITIDLQQQNINNLNKYSPYQMKIILAVSAPSQLNLCYPVDHVDQGSIREDLVDGKIQTFVDSQGKVIKCQPECAKCSAGGFCQICSLGYQIKQGACVYCNGCKSCNPDFPSICTACFTPQVLNKVASLCVLPTCTDINCKSCNILGFCLLCNEGFSVYNDICRACITGCASCTASLVTCDVNLCQSGYIYYSVDKLCAQCAAGCLSCSTTNLNNCTSCVESFYGVKQVGTGVIYCMSCLSNCMSCIDNVTCAKCLSGFYLSPAKNQCLVNCDSSCQSCMADSPSTCTLCYAGSFFNAGKCMTDLLCNKTQSCTTCTDLYAINNGYCYACNVKDSNCASCQFIALDICMKCIAGYYLKGSACIICKTQCIACLAEASCISCQKGFYLNTIGTSVTGVCKACDSSCLTCSKKPKICTSCYKTYSLDGRKCISDNRIVFGLSLDINLAQFIQIAQKLVQTFLNLANLMKADKSKPFTAQDFSFGKIRSGSTIVSGTISIPNTGDLGNVASGLSDGLSSLKDIGGYSILSAQITKISAPVVPVTPTQNTSQSTITTAILLGILIPSGIIITIAVAVIVIKLKRKYQDEKFSTDNGYQQDKIDDSVKDMIRNSDLDSLANTEKI